MGSPNINNIGAYFVTREGLAPAANAAGTRNGTGLDRLSSAVKGAKSCTIISHTGAATGGPTSFTRDVKLQDSADNSAWADLAGAAVAQQTAAGLVELDVDLSGAKQYVRAVEVTTLTGGTAPTLPGSVEIVFGGADSLPL